MHQYKVRASCGPVRVRFICAASLERLIARGSLVDVFPSGLP
jgi:hypothetical protein